CWKMTIGHCSRSSRVGRRGYHELPSCKVAGFVLFSDIVPGTYSKLTGQNLLWATICTRSDTQQLHYIVAHRRVSVASNLLPCYVELESIDVNIVRFRRQPGYFAQHSPGADSTKDRFPSYGARLSCTNKTARYLIAVGHHASNHDFCIPRLARSMDRVSNDGRRCIGRWRFRLV